VQMGRRQRCPTARAVLGYLTASPCRQPAPSSAPYPALSKQILQSSCCRRQTFSKPASRLSTLVYIVFSAAALNLRHFAAQQPNNYGSPNCQLGGPPPPLRPFWQFNS
jgi:hypothetical protein